MEILIYAVKVTVIFAVGFVLGHLYGSRERRSPTRRLNHLGSAPQMSSRQRFDGM